MKIFSKNTWAICLLSVLGMTVLFHSCKRPPEVVKKKVLLPFEGVDSAQVEAVLEGLTLEEKIGQLIIWQPNINDSLERQQLFESATGGRVGGVLLRGLSIAGYLYTADSLRRSVKLPLFFATDEKVSLHNQFSGLQRFPLPVTMAAIDSSGLQRMLERQYVRQCKALGINFCLSPTLKTDDPASEGFDFQTFENDETAISERSNWMAQHLQRNRIFTAADSFSEFLFVKNDTIRDSLLHHFLIHTRDGLTGLKVEGRVFQDDTLRHTRPNFVRNYLRSYLDFNGLMVVELGPKESPEQKLLEGADIFLTPNARLTFQFLQKMVVNGIISEREIDRRVRQVLKAKAWVHGGRLPIEMTIFPIDSARQQRVRLVSIAEKSSPVILRQQIPRPENMDAQVDEIVCYFEDPNWGFFIGNLFENSVILARDERKVVPFKNLYDTDFQVFGYGHRPYRHFTNFFSKYANFEDHPMQALPSGALIPVEFNGLESSATAVILLDSVDLKSGFHKDFIESVNALARKSVVVLVNFGNPKNLRHFDPAVACVQIFERNEVTEIYAAQMLFGGVGSEGRLPVAVSESLPFGAAVNHPAVRLGFAAAEKTGILNERLVSINAIAESAIDKGVFPGCQVVVAKDGQVIYSQAFGYYTYDKKKKTPVKTTDLFDIASVTKVAATTLAVMKLEEQHKIDLKNKLADYLKLDARATVGSIKIRDLLLHNSGLQAQMPLAKYFSYKNVPARGCNEYFCRKRQGSYDVKVADGLYLRRDHQDTIAKRVYRLPVSKPRFRYSDVNFFLLQKLVEKQANMSLDRYVFENIYRPLGLRFTTYNPLEKFQKSQILPTENDRYWRKTLVQGTVHDPAAALMGGVGGNAGIFSNAEDLAALFQMLLNGGVYGGEQFFETNTVQDFTASKYGNHRGLGFDKPANRRYPTYSKHASSESFGHTGFTGTCVWVDPEEKLVYIFLSNRVYPSSRNGKIFTEATRSRIHEVVYDALGTFRPELPELAAELIEEE